MIFASPVVAAVGLAATIGIAASALAASADLPAASQPAASQPSSTVTSIQFQERSPHSSIIQQVRRLQITPRQPVRDYQLENETFDLYVPAACGPGADSPCGAIVWISAFNTGQPPPTYLPLLDRHHLIWVAARNSGNDRPSLHRYGLALDAANNIGRCYKVDPDRLYVAGFSGGGRCSSLLGVQYPDVFAGALPICGCDTYRLLPVPGMANKYWAADFRIPLPPLFRLAKQHSRFVLLTADNDPNRLQTETIYNQVFKRDAYAHVTYLQVPEKGHEMPPAGYFEQAIAALDQPLQKLEELKPAPQPKP